MRLPPNDTLLAQMAGTKVRYAIVLAALLGSMAIPVLARAQGQRASSAKIQFDKGQTFFDMGQYERAIREFEIGYRLASGDDATTYAVASTTLVIVDAASGRPVALPDPLRAALTEHVGDPVPFRG